MCFECLKEESLFSASQTSEGLLNLLFIHSTGPCQHLGCKLCLWKKSYIIAWSILQVTSEERQPYKEWVKVTQSCLTLWPKDYTVHGILQAKILEWVAIPFSRGSSQPRNRTQVSRIAGGFFTNWATKGSPYKEKSKGKNCWPLRVGPWDKYISKMKMAAKGLSWCPVAKTPCSQCRGPGFDPWSGN